MTSVLLAGVTLAAGCSLAALGPLTRRTLAGLTPRSRARCAAACLAGAVVLVCSGLVLLAIPAVFELLPHSALGGWRLRGAGLDPAGSVPAWLAVCLLVSSLGAVAVRAGRSRREHRMLRVEDAVGQHERRAGFDLVTLPGAAVVAYSTGGRSPQVVLSEGLRGLLDADAVAAVVAHEAAHLRARHGRWLRRVSLAEAALWFIPRARTAAGALRLAVEQWADQDAASEAGTQALRRALLGAAGIEPVPSGAAALSAADALSERLAMLAQEPRPGPGLRLPGVSSLAAMAGSTAGGAGGLAAAVVVFEHLCG